MALCAVGVGSVPPDLPVAEARAKAFENRQLARSRGDPLAAKRRAKPPTFRQAASRTRDALRPRWRNRKHAKDRMATRHLRCLGGALGPVAFPGARSRSIIGFLGPSFVVGNPRMRSRCDTPNLLVRKVYFLRNPL